MARCDQGYLCRICGDEVEHITDSVLYLRYVLGEIDPEVLHLAPEAHLHCAPALAQFIQDERLGTIAPLEGAFSLAALDPAFVEERRAWVTRGYQRLWEIRTGRAKLTAVRDYPLSEVLERWQT